VRNHRYRGRVEGPGFFLFLGINAEVVRTTAAPSGAEPVGDRLWLDASRVVEAFRGTPWTVSEEETGWLRAGLACVAADIARAEPVAHVTVAVRALEVVEVDYLEAALAPAIAGWAAAEFGFTAPQATISRLGEAVRYSVEWHHPGAQP
jgi:hypothetical protein